MPPWRPSFAALVRPSVHLLLLLVCLSQAYFLWSGISFGSYTSAAHPRAGDCDMQWQGLSSQQVSLRDSPGRALGVDESVMPAAGEAGSTGVRTESLSANGAAGLIRLERVLKTRIATVDAMLKSLQQEKAEMRQGREAVEERGKEDRAQGKGERGGEEEEDDDLLSWVDAAAGGGSGSGGGDGKELVVEGDEAKLDDEEKANEREKVANSTLLSSPPTSLPPHLSLLLSHLTPSHLPPVCRTNPITHSLSPITSSLFPPPPRLIPWTPHPHRYLLATCSYGRTSNHLLCIRRYLAFAALLNRSLLLPVVPRAAAASGAAWHKGSSWFKGDPRQGSRVALGSAAAGSSSSVSSSSSSRNSFLFSTTPHTTPHTLPTPL
ncbi:hypothetical protein CLOP_g8837 [Closterium sp. NIES-67]|nr:hypothetical protein CLOP_g8837 [Closterium sp. NIES-67]